MIAPPHTEAREIERRKLLKAGGLGLLGVGAAMTPLFVTNSVNAKSASRLPERKMPKPFAAAFKIPPPLHPDFISVNPANGKPVHHFTVTELSTTQEIVPGFQTPIMGYNGIFPGPTINIDQGTEAVLTVRNQLPPKNPVYGTPTGTSTHLHGSASLPQYDGYANDVTEPGFKKDYHYPNFQPARTLWYHDHGVHHTSQNAYSGLAAMYQLHDPAERSLLPQGEYDIPLVVSDMQFLANGTAGYDDHGHSGLWGDVILVNGTPWPVMKVKKRIYRFRILASSLSRSFRWQLSTKEPLYIVGTDGGMTANVIPVQSFRHAGAERYEVLIDFSKYKTGQEIILQNLSNKNNIDYNHTNKIMKFVVTDEAFSTTDPSSLKIPGLMTKDPVMALDPNSAVKKRKMEVERKHGMWMIDDQSWHDVVSSNFEKVWADPELNDVEIWEIENRSGGWFHPLHIHLVDFKILSRNGSAPLAHEAGPKDVVYVGEGETVVLLMRFEKNRGRYMIHCHNLPHEDHDMMLQYSVGLKKGDPDPNDPMQAAPPVRDIPA